MNKLDSALHHARLAYRVMVSFKGGYSLYDNVFNLLGNIEAKSPNNRLALHYYQKSVQAALNNKNYTSSSRSYTSIASLYRKMNLPDSAIYYAKQGLVYGQQMSYEIRILAAAKLLAELYEPIDDKEALRYYKIAGKAQESLYGAEKVQKFQAMMLDIQERHLESEAAKTAYQNKVRQYALLAGLGAVAIIAIILYRNNREKQKANFFLQQQKDEIDIQKSKLQQSLNELKDTQTQLVQSEKMASLGELTAGIAHEIQNPLNFVNNFSDVNTELIEELKQEASV